MAEPKPCICYLCKGAREKRLKFLGLDKVSPGARAMWVPREVRQALVTTFAPRDTGEFVDEYHFTAEYRGKAAPIKVIKMPWDSYEQIEDMLGAAVERWKKSVDDELSKAPLATDTEVVGVAIRDFVTHTRKRRASSKGRIYYEGAN